MKTFQKMLGEKDTEIERLANKIATQDSKLAQMHSMTRTQAVELRQHTDILAELMELRKKLSDVKDERHITATELKLIQKEISYNQKHAPTPVSAFMTCPVYAC